MHDEFDDLDDFDVDFDEECSYVLDGSELIEAVKSAMVFWIVLLMKQKNLLNRKFLIVLFHLKFLIKQVIFQIMKNTLKLLIFTM